MSKVNRKLEDRVSKFIYDINNNKITDSYNITFKTVSLLKEIVSQSEWTTAQELLEIIQKKGGFLIKSLPLHSCVANMVRRISKIIREEYVTAQQNRPGPEDLDYQDSLHKIITSENDVDDYRKVIPDLKSSILDHIGELQMELETSGDNIARQAGEHIYSDETVLTLGRSSAVEVFLLKAAEKIKFDVIVVEGAPFCKGHELAVILAKKNIRTTVIPDSAVFAIMPRVNKVIIGTHAVMANGGLRAVCGSHMVALAAQRYSVPVIVLAPMYKLSPQYLCSYDQDTFNKFDSPEGVLEYSEGSLISCVHVYNPVFDYVPPELVTIFISNTGGHAPSYIYRLLSELYHPDDQNP